MHGSTNPSNSAPHCTLLADVGGTNCRLGLFDPSTDEFVARTIYSTDEFPSPAEAITAFLADVPGPRPRSAALALACPVSGAKLRLTNTGWSFDHADLLRRFHLERLIFVNDLVAQARGLCKVPLDRVCVVGSVMPASLAAPAVIVNAGTGLGVARIDNFEEGRVAASEAGHAGFSPSDDIEIELLQLWRRQLGRVTNEHLISGPGIARLYRGLGAIAGARVEPIGGPEIVRRGVDGSDALCVETAERFVRILGAVAGDICATVCASTVVLLGTIVNALAPVIALGGFRGRFEQCGPGALLKTVPTVIADEPDLGLLGAYAFLTD